MTWIETLLGDIRYGARLFGRHAGTTLLAVLTLSLGIGANAVIYSLLHAVLLRPLPFPDAERLVAIVDNFRTDGVRNVPPTVPELLDVRAASRHLDGITFFDMRDVQISGGTEPARAFAARIEAGFLSTIGVQPALGRLFTPDDHLPGRDRVVILTDRFWRRNLGADPSVIGRTIVVNGVPCAVLAVLPPGFSFDYLTAEPVELYVPFPMNPAYTLRSGEFANVRRVTGVARLKPATTLQQASRIRRPGSWLLHEPGPSARGHRRPGSLHRRPVVRRRRSRPADCVRQYGAVPPRARGRAATGDRGSCCARRRRATPAAPVPDGSLPARIRCGSDRSTAGQLVDGVAARAVVVAVAARA
jgi:hypothetical protein